MKKEKKIWLFEQYSQKIWTLAASLMKEAARMEGGFRKSYAVIANECNNMSKKMFEYTAMIRFDNCEDNTIAGIISDAGLQISLLAVNAELELLRDKNANNANDTRSIAVCIGDIRAMALEIIELTGEKTEQKPFIIPEILSPVKSTDITDFFFKYSFGGVSLVENTKNIMTVEYPDKSALADGIFNCRGIEMPVIDCYKRFDLKHTGIRQPVMTICPGFTNQNGIYAVPIDDLDVNAIFKSKIAYNAPPKESHVFAGYSRECWDVIGGEQLVFADWLKFIE